MIGIVIIAHAKMASEAKKAVEHVLSEQPLLVAVDIENSDDVDSAMAAISQAIRQCDTGSGVLVFADMFGGTPCNLAQSSARDCHCEVISGFNLPALIKATSERKSTTDLHALATATVAGGRQYMCVTSDFMQGGQRA